MKQKLAKLGSLLPFICGMALSAGAVLVVAAGGDLSLLLNAALVFASGLVVMLLSLVFMRLGVFSSLLRHLEYLTQVSEYMARLVREITEVMKAIEEAEQQQQAQKEQRKGSTGQETVFEPISEEEKEIEKAVRQFEL